MPVTQEFIESLMKQNQMHLEQIEKLNRTKRDNQRIA